MLHFVLEPKLSEFISKNQEHPNPQIELQKSELLVRALVDSGSVPLLEKLRDSIISNPIFNKYLVSVNRSVFVNDRSNILNHLKNCNGQLLERSVEFPGSNLDFAVKFPQNDLVRVDSVPCVRVELIYNLSREEDMRLPSGGCFRIGPPERYVSYGSYLAWDALGVDCYEPEKLKLYLKRKHRNRLSVTYLEESQWRKEGVLDGALGALYSEAPARKKIEG